jgi:pimeloyl-ACP methyl ester carboxylesterase
MMLRRALKSLTVGLAVAALGAAAAAEDRFVVDRHGSESEKTVFFVPGLASSGATWDGAVAGLGDTADIHVFTLAGFAGVPPVETDGSFVESAADAIADYIVAGGYTDIAVVGHSLGGQVALQIAARAPGTVNAVMVVDSVPFFARLFNPAATPEQAAASGQMFAAQMGSLPNEQFLAMMAQGLPVQSLDTGFHATLTEWFAASDQAIVAAAFGEISGRDFSPVLEQIDVPVLVLAPWAPGAPVDAETIEAMYAAQYAPLESAQVEIIEGARHFLMIDQPDAFNARLARFLAETR